MSVQFFLPVYNLSVIIILISLSKCDVQAKLCQEPPSPSHGSFKAVTVKKVSIYFVCHFPETHIVPDDIAKCNHLEQADWEINYQPWCGINVAKYKPILFQKGDQIVESETDLGLYNLTDEARTTSIKLNPTEKVIINLLGNYEIGRVVIVFSLKDYIEGTFIDVHVGSVPFCSTKDHSFFKRIEDNQSVLSLSCVQPIAGNKVTLSVKDLKNSNFIQIHDVQIIAKPGNEFPVELCKEMPGIEIFTFNSRCLYFINYIKLDKADAKEFCTKNGLAGLGVIKDQDQHIFFQNAVNSISSGRPQYGYWVSEDSYIDLFECNVLVSMVEVNLITEEKINRFCDWKNYVLCESSPFYCGAPDLSFSLNIGCSHHAKLFKIGDTITQYCDHNLTLNGYNQRTCQENGHWSGEVALCIKNCTDVPYLENGFYIVKFIDNVSVAIAVCDNGYKILGNYIISCAINWTEGPVCRKI